MSYKVSYARHTCVIRLSYRELTVFHVSEPIGPEILNQRPGL